MSPTDLEDLYLKVTCNEANGNNEHDEQTKGTFELRGVDHWPWDDAVTVLNTPQAQLDLTHEMMEEIIPATKWFIGSDADSDDGDFSDELEFKDDNYQRCKIELWDEDLGSDDKIATSGWFHLLTSGLGANGLPCEGNWANNHELLDIVEIGPAIAVKIGYTTTSCN
eukprot:CAMPEP_0201593796 /NCGR_PEP_ID=MMETSP0190_2-20130828/191306_1 /ASSEMBLY_ACC=CAM_ASM_000263 /TAXON_ID=37353 /ORGANISM="Rosalina sp." /LENGTH=166 /DNA_ID=CAMNT_0048053151 /DNA_START=182 /DNA_END=682 /DNA_ORIENTATION=+